jgi:ABC-type sugar transport system, permease component
LPFLVFVPSPVGEGQGEGTRPHEVKAKRQRMLILGIIVILFPLYVAFVAATLDTKAVFDTPMTLIPGGHLFENMKTVKRSSGKTASR